MLLEHVVNKVKIRRAYQFQSVETVYLRRNAQVILLMYPAPMENVVAFKFKKEAHVLAHKCVRITYPVCMEHVVHRF